MDLDSSGHPAIAWHEITASGPRMHLRKWTGTQWGELGGSATGDGISASASFTFHPARVKLDASDRPVVAWTAFFSNASRARLRAWDGAAWVERGGSDTGTGVSGTSDAQGVALALDPAGHPVLAWATDTPGNASIYLKKWNGSAWTELGGSATGSGVGISGFSGMTLYSPALAVDASGNPAVAWFTSSALGLHFRRWTGSAWQELGGSATGTGLSPATFSSLPCLALDSNGHPVVAWVGEGLFLKRWNGSAWVELGGSATGTGISASAILWEPQLVIDSFGHPIVCWVGRTPAGSTEIYVKRWDGAQWTDWGTNAGSGGGISNAQGLSSAPAMAGRGGFLGVAWQEWGEYSEDIYFRKSYRP